MLNLPKKTIIAIFIFILGIELIWAFNYANKLKIADTEIDNLQKIKETTSKFSNLEIVEKENISIPSIILSPNKGKHKIGEIFLVEIKINTAGQTVSGADIELFYDQAKIEPLEEIKTGDLFPAYPLIKIDKKKMKIAITGTMTSPGQKPFTGQGLFATLKFKAISAGVAKADFRFTLGSTADTNLIEKKTGKDILVKVKNGLYTIY